MGNNHSSNKVSPRGLRAAERALYLSQGIQAFKAAGQNAQKRKSKDKYIDKKDSPGTDDSQSYCEQHHTKNSQINKIIERRFSINAGDRAGLEITEDKNSQRKTSFSDYVFK